MLNLFSGINQQVYVCYFFDPQLDLALRSLHDDPIQPKHNKNWKIPNLDYITNFNSSTHYQASDTITQLNIPWYHNLTQLTPLKNQPRQQLFFRQLI